MISQLEIIQLVETKQQNAHPISFSICYVIIGEGEKKKKQKSSAYKSEEFYSNLTILLKIQWFTLACNWSKDKPHQQGGSAAQKMIKINYTEILKLFHP